MEMVREGFKPLYLTLTRQWFDMILSGEKKEEYREIKPYWAKFDIFKDAPEQRYTHIEFRNGYGHHRPSMIVELEDITQGKGKPEWGAPEEDVWILKLGRVVHHENPQEKKHV